MEVRIMICLSRHLHLSLCWIRCRMEWQCMQHGGPSPLSSTWRCTCSIRQEHLDATVRCCHCCCFSWSCWPGEPDSLLGYVINLQGAPPPQKNLLSLFPRFLLENFYFDEHVRYIVTIYPVVILWLTGILNNSSSPESPIYIFAGTVWHFSTFLRFGLCDQLNFSVTSHF